MYICLYHSPIGRIFLASNGDFLTGLWLEGQNYFASNLPAYEKNKLPYSLQNNLPVFKQAFNWLDIYFSGNEPDFTPKLNPQGSPFRKTVWDIMLKIPYGKTTTYGQIAQQIAKQKGIKNMSAQAVGGAVGHNPISIIIPCHRVIGANGNLTGYAGGLDKKCYLLKLEKAIL